MDRSPEVGRRLAVRAGNHQSGKPGRPFAAQLAVAVTDAGGDPVPGVQVTFRVVSGSATFGRGARSATATTAPNGLAVSAVIVAGATPGSVQVTAGAGRAPHPVPFTLRVTPGP